MKREKTYISRIYLEMYFTNSKTKNRHLIWKGKLFNYTIAHRTTGLIGFRYINITAVSPTDQLLAPPISC